MICDDIRVCLVKLEVPKKTLVDKKGGHSKYCIDNPDRNIFDLIDFETCVYNDREHDTKCDFGILTQENIFYIELKGSDVKKGVEQLLSTIADTRKCFEDKLLKARLVVSRYPKPALVRQTKEYKDLVKIVNQNLIITQNIHTEKI